MITNAHAASAGSHGRSTWAVLLTLLLTTGFLVSACEDDDETKRPAAPEVNFLYVTVNSNATVEGFLQDKESGELAPMEESPFNGANFNRMMFVHPSLEGMIVDEATGSRLVVKGMNPDTGALSSISEGSLSVGGGGTAHLTMSPDGSRLYATDDLNQELHTFEYDPTEPSLIESVPALFTGLTASAAALHSSGSFLYTFDAPNNFRVYEVSASDGSMSESPSSPFALGYTGVFHMVTDPLGEYLFAYSSGSNDFLVIETDQGNGDLVGIVVENLTDTPNGITITPSGDFVYVATTAGLHGYELNRANGDLTPVPGSPFHTGENPQHAAATPDGQFLYVAEAAQSVIVGFEIEADGSLTEVVAIGDAGAGVSYVVIADPDSAE